MNYDEALAAIGGFSQPSKMPWYSWSISAHACNTGSQLALVPQTTCSQCYALKGFYVFKNVRDAMNRRLHASQQPGFVDAFVIALTCAYEKQRKSPRENRFRWFDSGDLQSLDMLLDICEIAEQTPFIDHWLPTREKPILQQFKDWGLEFPPNLTVRYSNPLVGSKLRKPVLDLPFSTVGRDDDTELSQCVAYQQDNKCLDCRQCWTKANVNYPLH